MSDRMPYIITGSFFAFIGLNLYFHDPKKIDYDRVAEWHKYELDYPDTIPGLADRVITHVKPISFYRYGGDVSVVIHHQRYEQFQLRLIGCKRGWYDRASERDTFEQLVGLAPSKRGSAVYVKGANKDEQIEFEYICKRYVR